MVTSKLLLPFLLLHLIAAISPASAQLDLWSHGCFDGNRNYTSNSTYKSNLDTLLTKITSTNISYGFYNFSAGQEPDQANAIALCRGDVEVVDCHTCLNFVISTLTGFCPNQMEAIGWADNCMLRYSSRSILGGKWENNPTYRLDSGTNATDIDSFANGVQDLLRTLPNKTAGGDSRLKFATGEAKLSSSQTVYALMQCTPDLPQTDCLGCLYWANYYILNTGDVLRGQTGVRVLLPSCYIRYELQKFYSSADSPPSPSPQAAAAAPSSLTSSRKGSRNPKVVITVVLGVLACLSLLVNFLVCCWIRQRTRPNKMVAFELDDRDEASNIECLQLDFNTIRDATEDFSEANLLGRGGFGAVYKGTLATGQKIAAKRLAVNSGQGESEFKNEVLLVAKLHHRNLVRLVGFCLEGEERLLIYEFLPNGSLDYILFDGLGEFNGAGERPDSGGGAAAEVLEALATGGAPSGATTRGSAGSGGQSTGRGGASSGAGGASSGGASAWIAVEEEEEEEEEDGLVFSGGARTRGRGGRGARARDVSDTTPTAPGSTDVGLRAAVMAVITPTGRTEPTPVVAERTRRVGISDSIRARAGAVRADIADAVRADILASSAVSSHPPMTGTADDDYFEDAEDLAADPMTVDDEDESRDGTGYHYVESVEPVEPVLPTPTPELTTDDIPFSHSPIFFGTMPTGPSSPSHAGPASTSHAGPSSTPPVSHSSPLFAYPSSPLSPGPSSPRPPGPFVVHTYHPWMPGGPRCPILLPSFETHIARAIFDRPIPQPAPEALPQMPPHVQQRRRRHRGADAVVEDAPVPQIAEQAEPRRSGVAIRRAEQDPSRKMLRIHFRTAHCSTHEQYISPEPHTWFRLAERSGLTGLRTLGIACSMDASLISAFVERWHPETNTFHMPFGEMTITLADIHQILQVPIRGRSCTSDLDEAAVRQRIRADLGVDQEVMRSWKTGIPLTHLETTVLETWMRSEVRDEVVIARYYLFLLLGSTVLVDKSTNAAKQKWLALLFDHDVTCDTAWGAGILAYVYRNLGQASRRGAQGIASCGVLIRCWVWAYFPHFREQYVTNPQAFGGAVSGAAEVPNSRDTGRLIAIRRMLDRMRYEEVTWTPWVGLDFHAPEVASARFRGILRIADVEEPYHPDRVLRQFGMMQPIPVPPIQPVKVVRNVEIKGYELSFADELLLAWDADPRPLIDLQGSVATHGWDMSADYLDWYDECSHPLVDPGSVRRDRPVGPIRVPPAVDAVARIQVVAADIRTYLRTPEAATRTFEQHAALWLQMLTGQPTPMAPPPPRQSQMFRDSVSEPGEGSGSQPQ